MFSRQPRVSMVFGERDDAAYALDDSLAELSFGDEAGNGEPASFGFPRKSEWALRSALEITGNPNSS
jgi:hypothetical protein